MEKFRMEIDALNAIHEQNNQIIELLQAIKDGGRSVEATHQTDIPRRRGPKPVAK